MKQVLLIIWKIIKGCFRLIIYIFKSIPTVLQKAEEGSELLDKGAAHLETSTKNFAFKNSLEIQVMRDIKAQNFALRACNQDEIKIN